MFSVLNTWIVSLMALVSIFTITGIYNPIIYKRFIQFISSGMRVLKTMVGGTGVRRVTGDNELDKVIETAGYSYDVEQDIFYSSMDAWQRDVGYCRLYDEAAVADKATADKATADKAAADKVAADKAVADKAAAEAKAKEPISLDFKSFEDIYNKMTDIQKDDFWGVTKGKYVQWTGEVTDVSKDSIQVKIMDQTLSTDFSATIIQNQRYMLININKGNIITIKGELSSKEGIIFPWGLSDSEIIK